MTTPTATKGELFEVRVRGMIARMFDLRNVEPTKGAWLLIRGEKEITVRDIAEIAYALNLHIDISFCEREAMR